MIPTTPKKFIGPTTSDCLKQARQQIGDDAIILSTRDTPKGIEIIAISPATLAHLSGSRKMAARQSEPTPALIASHTEEDLISLLDEVKELIKSNIANKEWASLKDSDIDTAETVRLMLNAGLSEEITGLIADELNREKGTHNIPIGERLQSSLEKRIRSIDPIETFDRGGIFPLIGSTGVGKTTVSAKIAARCALRFGRDNVALLTTDNFRIGAQKQTEVYSEIIGIPTDLVSDEKSLTKKIEELSGRKIILIDTAGMSQRDMKMIDQLQLLSSIGQNCNYTLVLSSTSNLSTLEDVILTYSRALSQKANKSINSVIITKTDEAAQIGPTLDCIIRHELPILFISNGQKVPEDLSPADISYLVYRALHPRFSSKGLEYSNSNVPLLMMDQLVAWAIRRSS